MKHKLESRLPGEVSITSDMQMTPPLWQKVKKSLLMKVKEKSEKVGSSQGPVVVIELLFFLKLFHNVIKQLSDFHCWKLIAKKILLFS